ncbi:MAG: endolytic transglycosylase MltG [Candidatus Cloacimonetes bacterium]|nr:endolytic transglycosylase MltG [Candidatus Cloacimonadota bacterium]MCF7813124.1 endolytic transglycosylase MltG [Candidatus Cloacimonadota bacterium]MCF7867572.1 endolytic transglycosylase MltG [Candidatus Cloacimonadota bacterium]MCF7883034.1 endolytic transglycosylase MltG [Candidatus Cloacimonadota bacterium]
MKLHFKILLPILLIIIILGSYLYYLLYSPKQIKETIIEIEKGEPALSIADKLYDKNLIHSREAFYLYIKFTGAQGDLSYGKYLFKGNLNMIDIIKLIQSGKVLLRKITIQEGLPAWKTCKLLSQKGFGDYRTFIKLYSDSTFAKKLTGFNIPNLEGFLYPETYFFPEESSEAFILEHLVKEFFNQTSDLDFKPNKLLNFYETIILASIVEREARLMREKPTIASVYINRLEDNYKLQADPTVAYVLELQGKNRKKIYYKDLLIDSPYNTYKHYGLPPTPICSPSRTSIEAVLNPAETDFYFFFADGTGGHEFTKTYKQHIFRQNQIKANNGK